LRFHKFLYNAYYLALKGEKVNPLLACGDSRISTRAR